MAVRSTMANLIASVRTLINDPAGTSQVFDDQTIQDIMDESRQDIGNEPLESVPTYVSGTIKFLDYYYALGGWEDGFVLKQYLTVTVTPSVSEPIAGHFQFAASTVPPVYISGSLHDRYRAAADLLERLAARWVLNYDFSSNGQSFRRSQAMDLIEKRIKTLRMKQRPGTISMTRSDLSGSGTEDALSLAPRNIDYMAL
jgi:hypothetical protein